MLPNIAQRDIILSDLSDNLFVRRKQTADWVKTTSSCLSSATSEPMTSLNDLPDMTNAPHAILELHDYERATKSPV